MTAGNSNEYGDDSFKNRFIDPETGEAYFLIINKETGKTKIYNEEWGADKYVGCLLYTSPSPRDVEESRMPSSA